MNNPYINQLQTKETPDWVLTQIYTISERESFLLPTDEITYIKWQWKMQTYAKLRIAVLEDLIEVEPSAELSQTLKYWRKIAQCLLTSDCANEEKK